MISKLQEYMNEHGIKITWLAEATKIPYNTLYKYVRYGIGFASKEEQERIITALSVTLEEVM